MTGTWLPGGAPLLATGRLAPLEQAGRGGRAVLKKSCGKSIAFRGDPLLTSRASSRPPRSKADDTPTLLIEAGMQLFGAKGYDGVTTRELADAAGTNISSIKYHFGGKEALYRAVLKEIVDEITSLIGPLLHSLRTGIAAADGNREVLKRLAEQFVQSWCRAVLVDPRTQIRIPPVVRELIQPSRHFAVMYKGFFSVLYDVLGELLAAARGRASVDDELRIQSHVVMNVVWGFIYTQSVFWHLMGWKAYNRERVERIVPILSDVFVHSLGLSDSQIACSQKAAAASSTPRAV